MILLGLFTGVCLLFVSFKWLCTDYEEPDEYDSPVPAHHVPCSDPPQATRAAKLTRSSSLPAASTANRVGKNVRFSGSLKEDVTRDSEHVARDSEHVARDSEHVARDSEHVARDSEHVARDSEHVARDSEHVARDSEHVARDSEQPGPSGINTSAH